MVFGSSMSQSVWPKLSSVTKSYSGFPAITSRMMLFKHLIVGESEEHRLHVGVVDAGVLHAVFLLVAAGKLIAF